MTSNKTVLKKWQFQDAPMMKITILAISLTLILLSSGCIKDPFRAREVADVLVEYARNHDITLPEDWTSLAKWAEKKQFDFSTKDAEELRRYMIVERKPIDSTGRIETYVLLNGSESDKFCFQLNEQLHLAMLALVLEKTVDENNPNKAVRVMP